MLNKKDFLKYASTLAFPIMLQNLIGTLVNIADTVMLGYVSQTAMSASSLANQYTFILFCLYYGMATGTSVLCAQYWGKGDKKTVEKILGLAERISLIISLIFFVISFTMPTAIMKIFTNSPETIAAGSEYLKVISFSFVFMGFSQIFMSALRSIGKIMLPSVTYIVSLCVNVFCNATFIFGLFGLPKLGVTGVALGTVIARISEVLICLIYSLRSSDVRFRIKYFFAKSDILLQDFIKIATPAVINDVVWSFANSAFAAILGHIGDDMVAANAVAVMVVNIGAIACRGFANATTIIVSQELGKDRIDTAREYGKRMYYLGIFIIMTTWRFVGEGINTCLICGCFRGGGDARFGMIVDTIFMWLVAVPLTFLAAYVFKLPPVWVYFVMTLDEFEKMPVVFIHYFRNKWLTNITRDFE
ncbi:MAG: MATE family efflux transporter [Roseburia inulinivorans]|nr:MAG: MATE family efflux transporter [Roseburia inulinivorans]